MMTNRPPVVLLADSNEWSARSLESILAPRGYVVQRATAGREALSLVRRSAPDAVIVELKLPQIDGRELCRRLGGPAEFPAAPPVIVVSSSPPGHNERLEAYTAGAWDFCTHPIDSEVLLAKLATFVAAKRAAEDASAGLRDRVTGLYSERGLDARAREVAAAASRLTNTLTCIVLRARTAAYAPGASLDDAEAAALLGGVLHRRGRVSDAIGRLGEREFAVIAPGLSETTAPDLVARIERAVNEQVAGERPGHAPPPRVVVRAAYETRATDGAPPDVADMLRRAASALADGDHAEHERDQQRSGPPRAADDAT